jgi:hypothetical protein
MHTGQDVRTIPEGWLEREWLMANGLGGYAAGTAADMGTRRTHALLAAAGPHGRMVTLLLRLDERLHAGGNAFELSHHRLLVDSCRLGESTLLSFECEPWPVWLYRAGGVLIEKSLLPITGHHTLAVRYRHVEGPPARLAVSPVVARRDPNALERAREDVRGVAGGVPGRVSIALGDDGPALTLWHNGSFIPARVWQHRLAYVHDADPNAWEDGFVPGHVEAPLPVGGTLHLVFADDKELFRTLAREGRLGDVPPPTLAANVALLEQSEREDLARRTRAAIAGADRTARQAAEAHGHPEDAQREAPFAHANDGWSAPLARTVLDGLTRRNHRLTVLDRLPSPKECVARTLRVVPGLLTLRAFEPARAILAGLTDYLHEGLAPETFDRDDSTPHYRSAEPALWLVAAAELYVRRSEDVEFARETLYPALEGVMQFYRSGTHHGIAVEPDGLLGVTGARGVIKDAALNALWAHALLAMASLARQAGRRENGAFYLAWAHEHQRRFNEALWDERRGCLYEGLRDDEPIVGLSARQVMAIGFAPGLLPPERSARLLATIERELATPLGLRPAPGMTEVATEWLGTYYGARLKLSGRSPGERVRIAHALDRLRWTLVEHGGAGRMPERFDLVERRPAGATLSVLAAAEVLRMWIEEIEHVDRRQPVPI